MVVGRSPAQAGVDNRLRDLGSRFGTDAAAFEEAYALLAPGIRSILTRLLPASDVDDVLQSTFADAWRSRRGYDPERSLRGWLLGIARHRCADLQRTRRPVPVPDADALLEVPGGRHGARPATDVAEQVTSSELVRAALRTTSAEQREVLVLAYFSGLTQTEIAEWLDVPLGTVKARCARGLRVLAVALRTGASDGR